MEVVGIEVERVDGEAVFLTAIGCGECREIGTVAAPVGEVAARAVVVVVVRGGDGTRVLHKVSIAASGIDKVVVEQLNVAAAIGAHPGTATRGTGGGDEDIVVVDFGIVYIAEVDTIGRTCAFDGDEVVGDEAVVGTVAVAIIIMDTDVLRRDDAVVDDLRLQVVVARVDAVVIAVARGRGNGVAVDDGCLLALDAHGHVVLIGKGDVAPDVACLAGASACAVAKPVETVATVVDAEVFKEVVIGILCTAAILW